MWQPDSENGTKAMILIDKAIKLSPETAEYYSQKAEFLLQTEEDDGGALTLIDRALAKQPNNPHYHTVRAETLARLNRLPEAKEAINKAMGKDADANCYMWQIKSNILHRLGDDKGAEDAITQSVRQKPNNQDFRQVRAKLRYSQNNFAGAIEDTSMIINDRQHSSSTAVVLDAYLIRARAYARSKKNDLAKQDYLLLHELAPDVRTALAEAKQFFQSIGHKKNEDLFSRRIKSLDGDYVMPK